MASSGSFTTCVPATQKGVSFEGTPSRIKFSWWTISQNIDLNLTEIGFSLEICGGSTDGKWMNMKQRYYLVDGYGDTNTGSLTVRNGTQLFSGTKTIYHEPDGTKTFFAEAGGAFYFYDGYNSTGSAYFTLDTIPRASSISATNGGINWINPIFTINKAADFFTHTLRYQFGTLSGTIVNKTSASIYGYWEIPSTFYSQIPNSKTGICTVYCDTYNGDNLLGSKSCTFIAEAVDEFNKPDISVTAQDVNTVTLALTGDNQKIVKYYSTISYEITATPKNSASIVSYLCTCGSASSNTQSGLLYNVDNNNIIAVAKDSRGISNAIFKSTTLIPYIKLTHASAASMMTTEGTIAIKVSGNFWANNFGAVNNTLSLQYRYKVVGGDYSAWRAYTPTIDTANNKYSNTINITSLDYTKSYIVQTRVVDKLMTVLGEEQTVTCTPIFDWGKDDFNFDVSTVTVQGNQIWNLGNLKVATGEIIVNIPSGGGVGYKNISFPNGLFTTNPKVFTTVNTAYPNEISSSISEITPNGCKLYLYRSSHTDTSVQWFAVEMG